MMQPDGYLLWTMNKTSPVLFRMGYLIDDEFHAYLVDERTETYFIMFVEKIQQLKIHCIDELQLIEAEWRTYASINLAIIGSDNGLSPDWCQAIIWTNARILLIGSLGTNFREILIENHTFSFRKMLLKKSSGKWRPFCIGLNYLHCVLKKRS